MNRTMVWLSLGTWVVVGACDGSSGSADRPLLPGMADEEQASASIRQVQRVDGALASGDPDQIASQHSASCDAGSNGSASCDADGCNFSQRTGGHLYAKWVSDNFGSYDATVSFP
jgi:hypothetical protein